MFPKSKGEYHIAPRKNEDIPATNICKKLNEEILIIFY
jgi:hypothetical protein